jgi:nucleotide-binding universal stress UspA family protein
MLRMLVPVDGSENSDRAVKWLIKKSSLYAEPLEIHLLNVQHSFRMIRGLRREAQQVHRKEGLKALASAQKLFDEAGVEYAYHIGVGEAPYVIAQYAKEKKVKQIVMGTRGLGAIAGLLLGSVTMKVISLTDVPVLLVK